MKRPQLGILDNVASYVAFAHAEMEELAAQLGGQEELPPVMTWFADWVAAGIVRRIDFLYPV